MSTQPEATRDQEPYPGKPASPTLHKVLIADDTPVNRFVLQHAAQSQGLEVLTASNGEEATEVLMNHPDLSLVLLDWMMPKMSGVDVCRWIRDREEVQKTGPYTYVIIITAKDTREDLHQGLSAGADDYLTKPVDPAELKLRIAVGKRVVELQSRLQHKIVQLQKRTDEVNALQDLLPMCMYCKNVRDDNGYWERVEKYLHRQSGADISHGICPTCYDKQLENLTE